MNLVLLGAPGAGKGTMSEFISKKLNVPVVSMGNILRTAMKNGTPVGLAAKAYVEAGKLVPDEVIISVAVERLREPDCQNGYILDGIPRTLNQAAALEEAGVHIQKALFLDAKDEVVEKRVVGRRTCLSCGTNYHIESNPPKASGICDVCGKPLVRRQDDDPELVRTRLSIFHKETEPVKDYYSSRDILVSVGSQAGIENTKGLVFQALEIL